MEVGDPKKAWILAFIAVGMCAFAVYRLMPKPEQGGTLPVENGLAQQSNNFQLTSTTTVLNDPFVHKALVQREINARQESDFTMPASKPKPAQPKNSEITGTLPAVPDFGEVGLQERGGDPEQSTQTTSPAREVSITVVAIVTADNNRALISLDSSERTLRINDVVHGWKVTKIETNALTLVKGQQAKTLSVGETQNL